MKKHVLSFIFVLLSVSFYAQNPDNNKANTKEGEAVEKPKGTWKVNKEFDENGNLIRYDSIYSWSSTEKYEDFLPFDTESFKSNILKIYSMFEDEGFEDIFSQDSLFNQRLSSDDLFKRSFEDYFKDIDSLKQQMIKLQMKFLGKYQSEFIKPEDEN